MAVDFRPRVYGSQPWAHTHHHLARLRAGVNRVVLRCGRLSRFVFCSTVVDVLLGIDGVLSRDLARLADSDTLPLTSNLHIWISLTTDDDVIFNEFDCVVLTVIVFGW